jgi:adenosylmethionine-8-amino-7-oxononanoate aminotransferase
LEISHIQACQKNWTANEAANPLWILIPTVSPIEYVFLINDGSDSCRTRLRLASRI